MPTASWSDERVQLARASPAGLGLATNPRYHLPRHIDLLDARLVDFCLEIINYDVTVDTRGHGPRLMVFMPPRHGKSQISSRYTPSWFIGQWPDRRATVASYAQALALSWGREARNLMTEFGPTIWGTNIDRTRSSAADWGIAGREGAFKAVGVGSGLTGTGADLLVIDDPFKDSMEAQSEVTRETVWESGTSRPPSHA